MKEREYGRNWSWISELCFYSNTDGRRRSMTVTQNCHGAASTQGSRPLVPDSIMEAGGDTPAGHLSPGLGRPPLTGPPTLRYSKCLCAIIHCDPVK
ncbi:hypothetical protein AAFF_G00130300 [Aldrovandia affinis]|uniref:Uncharacterized protein n=1 Tax=Aldrovandia affinis TaxID=143900 RepID=A0AAD7W9F2_9TELE|nr:hypothetical protein AAFF_G00130300 [Aldrovandia affinis]